MSGAARRRRSCASRKHQAGQYEQRSRGNANRRARPTEPGTTQELLGGVHGAWTDWRRARFRGKPARYAIVIWPNVVSVSPERAEPDQQSRKIQQRSATGAAAWSDLPLASRARLGICVIQEPADAGPGQVYGIPAPLIDDGRVGPRQVAHRWQGSAGDLTAPVQRYTRSRSRSTCPAQILRSRDPELAGLMSRRSMSLSAPRPAERLSHTLQRRRAAPASPTSPCEADEEAHRQNVEALGRPDAGRGPD